MRNLPTESRRYNEGMLLLGAHGLLLAVGVLIQVLLATGLSDGMFAASYGFVLVYAYVVATTIGYGGIAVRVRQQPLGARVRYLAYFHLLVTVLMAGILLAMVYTPIAVPLPNDTPPSP